MTARRPLEIALERRAVAYARTLGIEAIKLNLQGRRGWPDRVFLARGGRPLLVEFKRAGEGLEPAQARVHRRLRRLGYDVHVVDAFTEARALLDDAAAYPR